VPVRLGHRANYSRPQVYHPTDKVLAMGHRGPGIYIAWKQIRCVPPGQPRGDTYIYRIFGSVAHVEYARGWNHEECCVAQIQSLRPLGLQSDFSLRHWFQVERQDDIYLKEGETLRG
jgi:hypothetical protein